MNFMPSFVSPHPSRNSAAEIQLTISGRCASVRFFRNHANAGPATPDPISRSRSIKNDESSSAGTTAILSGSILRQLCFGPIGELMSRHDFPERPGVNQLGARHLTLSGSLIELLEFVSSVSGRNGKFLHACDNR